MDHKLKISKGDFIHPPDIASTDAISSNGDSGLKRNADMSLPGRYFKTRKVEQKEFLDLSEELIVSVLRYISNIKDINSFSKTCKRLRSICKGNLTNIDFSKAPNVSKKELLEFFNENTFRFCERINLSKCHDLDEEVINDGVVAKVNNLKEINLSYCTNIDNSSLIRLALGCKTLSKVSIKNCVEIENRVDGAIIGFFIDVLPNLETLSLRHNGTTGFIIPASPLAINRENPNLKFLDIRGVDIVDEDLSSILKNCKSLKSLSIGGNCTLAPLEFTGGILYDPEIYPAGLEQLRINYCRGLNEEALKAIAKSCKKLQSLSLLDCQGLSSDSLANFSDLRELSIGVCEDLNDEHLQLIAAKNPNLEILALERCNKIEAGGAYFTNLRRLILSDCERITAANFSSILKENRLSLEYLNLYSCDFMEAELIEVVNASCPNLRKIVLSSCWEATDDVVGSLVEKCPNLKYLTLYDCSELTASFAQIIKQRRNDLELKISNC